MKQEIISYINVLHGYTTAIKNLHWSSQNMSEHKLCDDIAETLASNEDEIAEIAQGIFGRIKNNELKPKQYTISSTQKMLSDLLKDTEAFYEKLDGKQFIGLRSIVENFLGEINKYQYLIKICLKEELKRKYSSNINEKQSFVLTPKELQEIVLETYHMAKDVIGFEEEEEVENEDIIDESIIRQIVRESIKGAAQEINEMRRR